MPETQQAVRDYLALVSIQVVAVSHKAADGAIEAFDRFGKDRHPAGLNVGDCFTYACARSDRMPLLFKGRDFALNDISVAYNLVPSSVMRAEEAVANGTGTRYGRRLGRKERA